jgi:DNA-3-methyladenine glycosylase
VETEAYGGPEDRASHARAGRTPRTAVMFGPPGRAYVYLVYGMHHCLNVVCGADGEAAAVLIRALQPLDGVERMRVARGLTVDRLPGRAAPGDDARLAAGPARLCQALGVDRALDGLDLLADERLRLVLPGVGEPRLRASEEVAAGTRVGVTYAGSEWAARPWRFGIAGHAALSRPFPGAV